MKRPKSERLPARRRASSSVVWTVMSASAAATHSSTVRTLWLDFETHVPQAADELLELSGERRVGVGTQQDQEIHIGVRIELAAAVSTDCDERHLARHRAALPDLAQPRVDERAQTPQRAPSARGAPGIRSEAPPARARAPVSIPPTALPSGGGARAAATVLMTGG